MHTRPIEKNLPSWQECKRERLSLVFLVFCNSIFMLLFACFSVPNSDSDEHLSPFEKAINDSSTLQLFLAGVIFCSLPLLVDSILDRAEGCKNERLRWEDNKQSRWENLDVIERYCILLAFIIPNAVFFILRLTLEGTKILPFVYLILSLSQNLMLCVSIYSTLIALCPAAVQFKYMLAATIFQVVTNVSQLISYQNVGYEHVTFGVLVFAETIKYSSMALIVYHWIRSLRTRSRAVGESSSFETTYDEQTCSIYLVFLCLSTVVRIVTSIYFNSLSWHTAGEETLVAYAVAQIFFCIPLTILPARNAKQKALNTLKLNRELKRNYLRYISHEVRSPLNVSHAGLEILAAEMENMKASETIKELVRDVYDANDTAVNILDDMLQFEYMDQGVYKIDVKKRCIKKLFVRKWRSMIKAVETRNIHVNLHDKINVSGQSELLRNYLGNTSLHHQQEDEETGLTAGCMLDIDHLVAFIDSERIFQVIRNLLLNATKYTRPGQSIGIVVSARKDVAEVTLQVPNTVESKEIVNKAVSRRAEGFLRFEVSDTGTGIVADSRSLIFREHAFSQHDLRGGGGTSLGLMISRTIISMHGGNMGCIMSPVGSENIFYFELPLFQPDIRFISEGDNVSECSIASNSISKSKSILSNKVSVNSGRSVLSSLKDALSHLDALSTSNNGNLVRPSFGLRSQDIADNSESCAIEISDDGITQDEDSGHNTSQVIVKLDRSRYPSVRTSHTNTSSDFSTLQNGCNVIRTVESSESGVTQRRSQLKLQRALRNDDDFPFAEDWSAHASGNANVKTFLIVDDSPTSQKILHRMLSCERELLPTVDFLFADDGSSAVDIVRDLMKTGPIPDCIFMDFTMVKMHGPEAARIMRTLGYSNPILGITGNVMTDDIQTFIDEGATEVLAKPLSRAKLLRALKGNYVITKNC